MIAVITQDEIDIPTMALPFLETVLIPQIPVRKMIQQTLVFNQKSSPAHVVTTVRGHHRDSGFVKAHMRRVKSKKQGNKKESKTNNSKKTTGTLNKEHLPRWMMTASIRRTLSAPRVFTYKI
jgi:hypothetical protein